MRLSPRTGAAGRASSRPPAAPQAGREQELGEERVARAVAVSGAGPLGAVDVETAKSDITKHAIIFKGHEGDVGALDGAFAGPDSHDWDLAAADLLVHEAGGLISTVSGQSLIYNRPNPVHDALLAAGRARHATLLRLIRDRLAEFA